VLIELYIFATIIIIYGLFTTLAIIGFNKLKRIPSSKTLTPNYFSIVVSARNEERNIKQFVNEIQKQTLPKNKFELIFIDDCSSDNTFLKQRNILINPIYHLKLIQQKQHIGKKRCLKKAIETAKGEIIITTDADVIYRHHNWLACISNSFCAPNLNMLVMPIDYSNEKSILAAFQITENIALTGITAGFCGLQKPFLCNGANLAFKKVFMNLFLDTNHK